MKNSKIQIFICFLLLSNALFSQSLSGNMKTKSEKDYLGYGTVNIYKEGKKVASILTDATGHFNIKLDTGYYKVEFKYVGHKALVKKVHITGDEKGTFGLDKVVGYEAPKVHETIRSYGSSSSVMMVEDRAPSFDRVSKRKEASTTSSRSLYPNLGKPGLLTAGEVNDFSKWTRWSDIVVQELVTYKKEWDLFPNQRYTVQLKNKNGFPIVDATVQLLDKNNVLRFEGRTDNTGKAELWGSLGINDPEMLDTKAKILYNNKSYSIAKLSPFKEGINTLTIDVSCEVPSLVDIAFVVDATGSMSDEINYLKEDMQKVIYRTKNDFQSLTFRFANVFYRDKGDAYLTKRQAFTDVLSKATDFIKRQSAGGGGDYPESPEVAIDEALDSLDWSANARSRIIFLVLDAPPHRTPEILDKLKDIIHKAAAKGVRIIPIAASGTNKATEYLMRTLALGTNGTYTFLTNDSGIGQPHIKPTTDNYKVELLNDLLIRLIKTYAIVPSCNSENNYDSVRLPMQNDTLSKLEWNLWPNPTSQIVNLKIKADIAEVYLLDITGKIIERISNVKKGRTVQIDLEQYPKGIYLISFVYKDKKFVKKVVKI